MICSRRFIVSGSVQGVGFRASAAAIARRLGVTGWVRNLDDGRVELLASADGTILKELEAWLWQGPPAARVDAVAASDCPTQSFNDFSVRG